MNSRERNSGERAILQCAEDRREVICSAPNAVRKGGSTAINPKKMYTYDHVFGPDATQADVYEGIVEPIVDEVLQGYNCTVFAYGQTGTGKTHTMEGRRDADMAGIEERRLADNAGIIPRAVKQVFDHLRSITDEHSVRVSHLELYNEQLSDLLGPEDVINDTLRMYEDPQKGTFVQGLEDIVVRSEEEIFAVLDKSAVKRRTAETLMNKYSSRSHSVFSITIHIKESTPEGADLLKVGKLNLVDLAGSENVGRSGAVKGRAREAGNINQSLLTLGRVITALVDRHPHIPYRDSKLTRLLQESLGGRNKTCVIATVTPASSSAEETASTLDYAYRAKSIKNRPTVNQMIAKHVLLKEYTEEIQKLKKELDANRTKHGVYLPPDEFQRLQDIASRQKDAISELETRNEDFEKKTASLKEKLDRTQDALARDQKQLTLTKQELEGVKNDLASTQETLGIVTQQKSENAHLVRKHVATEVELHQKGVQLQDTIELCVGDIRTLHVRVNKKHELEKENIENLLDLQNTVAHGVSKVSDFLQLHEQTQTTLLKNSETTAKLFLEKVNSSLDSLNVEAEKFSAQFSKLEQEHDEADMELSADFSKRDEQCIDALRKALVEHKASVAETSQKVSETSASIHSMIENTRQIMGDVRSAIASHSTKNENTRQRFAKSVLDTVANLDSAVAKRIKRQAELYGILKLVSEEEARKQTDLVSSTRSKLVAQVTAVMDQFEQESKQSREQFTSTMVSTIDDAEKSSQEIERSIAHASAEATLKSDEFSTEFANCAENLESVVQGKGDSLTATCDNSSQFASTVQSSLKVLEVNTNNWQSSADEDLGALQHERAKFLKSEVETRERNTQERRGVLREQNEHIRLAAASLSKLASDAHDKSCNELASGREQIARFVSDSKGSLMDTVCDPVKSHAISCDAQHDESPLVRQWPIKEELVRTQNHWDLISTLRSQNASVAVPVEDFGHYVPQKEAVANGDLSSNDSAPMNPESVEASQPVFIEKNLQNTDMQDGEDSDMKDDSHAEKKPSKMARSRSTASITQSASGGSLYRSASAEPVGKAEAIATKGSSEKEEKEAAPVLNDTTNRRTRLRMKRGESMIPKKPSGIPSARTRGSMRSRARDVK